MGLTKKRVAARYGLCHTKAAALPVKFAVNLASLKSYARLIIAGSSGTVILKLRDLWIGERGLSIPYGSLGNGSVVLELMGGKIFGRLLQMLAIGQQGAID